MRMEQDNNDEDALVISSKHNVNVQATLRMDSIQVSCNHMSWNSNPARNINTSFASAKVGGHLLFAKRYNELAEYKFTNVAKAN